MVQYGLLLLIFDFRYVIATGYSSILQVLPSFVDQMNKHNNNIRINVLHSTVIIIKFPQGTL